MEMERINDNTIRVSIGNGDLEERGITFLDLLGNQKQIENFFYSILEEVDVDDQFQETDSVTFQVLPKQDGLELFISKNLPLDDINSFDDINDSEVGDNFSDFLKKHIDAPTNEGKGLIDEELDLIQNKEDTIDVIFKLDEFEAAVTLANNVHLLNVLSHLYKFKGDYYLRITFFKDEVSEYQIRNDMSVLYEYANRTNVTMDILEEYGEVIMELNALELIRFYFK